MLWKKPAGMKYTDMCIWIDENAEKLVPIGSNKEVEDTIYNYFWLLTKALAIKKHMFENFADYDGYAFYSAKRLFFALRKNLENRGKIIKGKQIKPIKSCLNYTKALLYPMKLEYQKETFNEIISEEFVSAKFDAFSYKEKLMEQAVAAQYSTNWFKIYVNEIFASCPNYVDMVLSKSFFTKQTAEYKYLKMSLYLNLINTLITKKKLDADISTLLLWKLPKSISGYIRVLLKEFKMLMKEEIMDSYSKTRLDDTIINKLISPIQEEYPNED